MQTCSPLRLMWAALVAAALPAAASAAPEKHALLVGCTRYENERIRELWGPTNDVKHWRELLTDPKGFAFPDANVRTLAGWEADAKTRPTRANIVAAVEGLVARSGPDVQVFILLSGHGMQVPIPPSQKDANDPKNPEPDGLDEVFLPADVGGFGEAGLTNAILDDEVGTWLRAMRDKGARVWVVFDCCHSGTMTRGDEQCVERPRTVRPGPELGIPDAAFREAARKSADALAKTPAEERGRSVAGEKPLALGPNKEGGGSVVAFYAAQPFEEAPELPRPAGSALVRENYFGLMSYTLMQTLKERQSPLSYRELAQIMQARYRADRSSRPPTPAAEGDLDREVLGASVWPKRADLLLANNKDGLTVGAGSLRGLVAGCVLAVHPPAGDARKPEAVIGHVLVKSSDPVTARVEPCDEAGTPGGDAAKLPHLSRCEMTVQDLGDLRVRLALLPEAAVKPALDAADKQVANMTRLVGVDEADWLLRKVTPAEAKAAYGIEVKGDTVLLVEGSGKPKPSEAAGEAGVTTRPPTVHARYPADDPKELKAGLERDIQKVFKWQNLWRVGGSITGGGSGPAGKVNFETLRLKDKEDNDGVPLQGAPVKAGDILGFRVTNEGSENVWVSVLFCTSDYGIAEWTDGTIGLKAGGTILLAKAEVSDDTSGPEGMVLLAVPQSASAVAPRFDFLAQEPLGQAEAKSRGPGEAPKSPFGQLLAASAFDTAPTHRGARKLTSNEPTIRTSTWVTIRPR